MLLDSKPFNNLETSLLRIAQDDEWGFADVDGTTSESWNGKRLEIRPRPQLPACSEHEPPKL